MFYILVFDTVISQLKKKLSRVLAQIKWSKYSPPCTWIHLEFSCEIWTEFMEPLSPCYYSEKQIVTGGLVGRSDLKLPLHWWWIYHHSPSISPVLDLIEVETQKWAPELSPREIQEKSSSSAWGGKDRGKGFSLLHSLASRSQAIPGQHQQWSQQRPNVWEENLLTSGEMGSQDVFA